MRKLIPLALSAALAAAVTPAAAAEEPGSRQTRDFLQQAASSDAFEMAEAASALAESRNPAIRSFAQRMIRDHRTTSGALTDAAVRAGLKPPVLAIGADLSPMLAALQSKRGSDFDQTYARQQALAHRSALTVEQAYASGGDQPAVKQAAAAATPIIANHLAMAEQLKAQLGGQ